MKEYTLQEIIELCDSERYEYPEVFADNCGLDIVIPEKGLHAVKSWGYRDSNRVRRATLEISVKPNWQIFPVSSRGIDFLGYVFYHTHTYLRKRIKQRFCRKVAQLNKRDITEKEYQQAVCSWIGWAKHCDSKHLLKKILK